MARGHLIAAGAGALMLALLPGCGDGPGPGQIDGSVSGPITKQRVEEFARRVNLRASDLPEARVARAPSGETDPAAVEEAAACGLDPTGNTMVASVTSPILRSSAATGERAYLYSTVSAAATGDEITSALRELQSGAPLACFERFLKAEFRAGETADARVLNASTRRLRRPIPLGTEGLAIRMHAPFVAEAKRYDFYFDVVIVSAGNSALILSAGGIPDPVDQNVERELLGVMVERAERHPL